jgi:predicted nucleic acid-binding protein
MKVLIDTNVIIDVLNVREPFFKESVACLEFCAKRKIGIITSTQTKDIFYLSRRNGMTVTEAKSALKKLTSRLKIIDVTAADVSKALDSDMPDYEDALIAFSCKRSKIDYIVSRNYKDFENSPVPALSPKDFITNQQAATVQ